MLLNKTLKFKQYCFMKYVTCVTYL